MPERSFLSSGREIPDAVLEAHLQHVSHTPVPVRGGVPPMPETNIDVKKSVYVPISDYELDRGLSPIFLEPRPEGDHSLWMARVDWHWPRYWGGRQEQNGIHFSGTTLGHSERRFESFGVTGLFELQEARRPAAKNRFWRSAPHAEMFGQLEWACGDGGGLFEQDQWLKFGLGSRQTVFQYGFGPSGPAEAVIADSGHQRLVIQDLHNSGTAGTYTFPGFYWLPPVVIDSSRLTTGSIWVRTELQFEMWPEGTSETRIASPIDDVGLFFTSVVFRSFQWAPEPI